MLLLRQLAAAAGTCLPGLSRVLIDVHDIHDVVASVSVVGVVPPWLPVAPINLVAVPVEVVVQPRAHGETNAKRDQRAVTLRVGLHIDDFRVVLRNVEIFGFCRNDANEGLFLDDHLLRGAHKVAGSLSLGAEFLNGIHHFGRLDKKRLSQTGRPFEVLGHPCDDIWIAGKGLDAVVPRLIRNLLRIAISSNVTRGEHDIGRHCRGGQDQGDQCIRIECDRGEQLFQAFRRERLGGGQRLVLRI